MLPLAKLDYELTRLFLLGVITNGVHLGPYTTFYSPLLSRCSRYNLQSRRVSLACAPDGRRHACVPYVS